MCIVYRVLVNYEAYTGQFYRRDQQFKKREVTFFTYKKWLTELDRCHQTISWLDCDTRQSDGRRIITRIKCRVCTKHKARISGRKHFSNKWIEGAESIAKN